MPYIWCPNILSLPWSGHQESQLVVELLEETFTSKNYKKFFNIKPEENLNLANIYVIKANKQMTAQLKGRPKKVTELKDGSLLVEVNSEEQSMLAKLRYSSGFI